jgi:hypothetical protein
MHGTTVAETDLAASASHPAGRKPTFRPPQSGFALRCRKSALSPQQKQILVAYGRSGIPLHRRAQRIAWVNAVVQELCSISDAAEEFRGWIRKTEHGKGTSGKIAANSQ